MKIENQEEIWDKIAEPWKTFRVKPLKEVAEFLRDKKGKILDLGCGSGRNFMKIKGTIYGVDFSEKMLKFAKEYSRKQKIKTEIVKAEAFDLPFENNFFDSSIFILALHCIPDSKKRERALKEILRVMKPGAESLVSVWNKDQDKFKNSKKEIIIPWKYNEKEFPRYYYLYDEKELSDLLEKTGFEILSVGNVEGFGVNSKKNIIVTVRKP